MGISRRMVLGAQDSGANVNGVAPPYRGSCVVYTAVGGIPKCPRQLPLADVASNGDGWGEVGLKTDGITQTEASSSVESSLWISNTPMYDGPQKAEESQFSWAHRHQRRMVRNSQMGD